MSSTSQPQPKRARTRESGSHSQGPQEELSQVTGLVEKRRLQNRISQRNYRELQFITQFEYSLLTIGPGNKIRDRLEALEALVDRSVKSDPVNVSTASLSRTSRDSTARDEALHQSRTEPPAQGHLTPSSPSAEHTRQWDSMHDFLDGPAAEFDSIYDFTDLQTSVEQYHPDTMRPDRFPNSTETMAASLLSPASTSYPTPPKKSESVNSDEQPISGKLSGTLDILAVAPENINENVSLEQQEQQKHYTVYKPPYPHSIPIPYPLVNTAIYPRKLSTLHTQR